MENRESLKHRFAKEAVAEALSARFSKREHLKRIAAVQPFTVRCVDADWLLGQQRIDLRELFSIQPEVI